MRPNFGLFRFQRQIGKIDFFIIIARQSVTYWKKDYYYCMAKCGLMKNRTIIIAWEWLGIMEHFFLLSQFSIFLAFYDYFECQEASYGRQEQEIWKYIDF